MSYLNFRVNRSKSPVVATTTSEGGWEGPSVGPSLVYTLMWNPLFASPLSDPLGVLESLFGVKLGTHTWG